MRLLLRRPVAPSLLSVTVGVATLGLLFAIGPCDGSPHHDRRMILDAIRTVERGGDPDPPAGDGGRALGPYQIHREYWADAVAFEPGLGGSYEDVRRVAYAERVIDAYMRRHAPDAWSAGDAETIARIHNGGPRGAERASTLGYWRKVKSLLDGAAR